MLVFTAVFVILRYNSSIAHPPTPSKHKDLLFNLSGVLNLSQLAQQEVLTGAQVVLTLVLVMPWGLRYFMLLIQTLYEGQVLFCSVTALT